MKTLLIYPPTWDLNLGPMLSVPLFAGMFKKEGHEVEIIDANAMYMNFIYSEECLKYTEKKLADYKRQLEVLQKTKKSEDMVKCIGLADMIRNMQMLIEYLKSFLSYYPDMQTCVSKLFESPNFAKVTSDVKMFIVNLFDRRKTYSLPKEYGFLYDWEQENIMSKIKEYAPELIGFSIYSMEQYDWSCDFAVEIKKHLQTTIVFGGSQITQIREQPNRKILTSGVDAFIYGEGESPLRAFLKKRPLKKIPNIVYVDDKGDIKINKLKKLKEKFTFYRPDYSGINLKDYFVPTPVLQIESSRGCYWHKCQFCTFMDCSIYKQKKVDDLIREIKSYVKKYNINHFFFSDAAIHPDYAREFSQKIIESGLKIYYIACLRLEEDYDYDLLKLMYDGGFRVAMWGLESGSDRILKMYNKGTTVANNARVLKLASEIGFYNYCWVITQFPKETEEDLILTKEFMINNYDYIDFLSIHTFTLMPFSPISRRANDFGLKESDFDYMEQYSPPEHIAKFNSKIVNELMNLYMPKMSKYSFDMHYVLLKLSKERP